MILTGSRPLTLCLVSHFSAAAAAGLKTSYATVRDGDDVTLPYFAETCDGTVWTFTASGSIKPVLLFECGKFHEGVGNKSTRLRLAEKCSLAIENASVDDAGLYGWGRFREEGCQYEVAQVLLSVVTSEYLQLNLNMDRTLNTLAILHN